MMTPKEIRELQFEKGAAFTTKFIRRFEREWDQVTQSLKKSGVNLRIPIREK